MVEEQETLVKEDYYEGNTGRKVGDFCMGFFGVAIIGLIYGGFIFLFNYLFNSSLSSNYIMAPFLGIFFQIFQLLILILGILICVKMFKIGRKYIAFGILAIPILAILALLILFGACFIAFSGGSGW